MEQTLDRAGLAYYVDEAPTAAAGSTIVLRGVETNAARLSGLARAAAPAHRLVVPEPLRFLYLGRAHVGQRWFVTGLDGEIEPATFGDALYAVEQLAAGAHARWPAPQLLVGHGQGGALALALALLVPELLAGVVALDAVLPDVPGWERPSCRLDGLPVLLLPGAQAGSGAERTRAELAAAGARLTTVADAAACAEAAALGPALDDAVADWWRAVAPRPPAPR